MRHLVVTPDTDWFSDPRTYLFFKYLCDQQLHILSLDAQLLYDSFNITDARFKAAIHLMRPENTA